MGADTERANAANTRSVFIVSEHPIFRHGLREVINREQDCAVTEAARDLREASEVLARTSVDGIVIDLSFHEANALELIRALRERHPDLAILVLGTRDESIYAPRVLRAGAQGYLLKTETLEEFVAALRKILSGHLYLSGSMNEQLVAKLAQKAGPGKVSGFERLSDRELDVLNLIGQGHTVKEVAQKLQLSAKTVDSHRTHLKEKLGLRSASELRRFAAKWVSQQRD